MCMPRGRSPWSAVSPGKTSISLTIQSDAVPDVETHRSAVTGPASVTFSSRTSVWYTSTSDRRLAKRWSSVMYSRVMPVVMSGV